MPATTTCRPLFSEFSASRYLGARQRHGPEGRDQGLPGAGRRISEVRELSLPDTYLAVSFQAAQAVVSGDVHRAILVCGTGVGTAIAASKVAGARAATAHDLVTLRGAVENYNAQILCMGQNVIAPVYARALVDLWLDLRHDPTGPYGSKLRQIDDYESRT